MSHVPRSPDIPIERDSQRSVTTAVRERVRPALRNVRVASFWAAIVLPIAYLPLLTGGLTGSEALLFAALIVANAGAFVVGHDYDPVDDE
jgi:Cu/Ag efflux pump CusA